MGHPPLKQRKLEWATHGREDKESRSFAALRMTLMMFFDLATLRMTLGRFFN
jgi:hypothetical protein